MTQAWHCARDRPRQTHPSAHRESGPGCWPAALLLRTLSTGLCTPPVPTTHRQQQFLAKYFIAAIPVGGSLGALRVGAGGSQHLLEQGNGLIHLPELCLCLLQLRVQKGYVVRTHTQGDPNTLDCRGAQVGKMGGDPREVRVVRLAGTPHTPSRPCLWSLPLPQWPAPTMGLRPHTLPGTATCAGA